MTAHLTAAWRAGSTDGRPGWRFTFGYDEDAIDALKAGIPPRYREWNESQEWWWVAIEQEQALLKLLPGLEGYMRQGALF